MRGCGAENDGRLVKSCSNRRNRQRQSKTNEGMAEESEEKDGRIAAVVVSSSSSK